MKMRRLPWSDLHDCDVEVDKVSEIEWDTLLRCFDDASMHQTWAAGEVARGRGNLSHLILRKREDIVGMCQVIISRAPILNVGIADIHYGPLWRKRGCSVSIEDFVAMICCIKEEYAMNRKLLVRLWPNEFIDETNDYVAFLKQAGFQINISAQPQRTLLLNLTPSLETLRKNLGSTWRLHLNRAEKGSLIVVSGVEDAFFEIVLRQLDEMITRKGFTPSVNYQSYGSMQQHLPDDLKMKIMIAELDGRPVSSIVCSTTGDTGRFLFGATANEGLKANASNLLHWAMVQWLKENGFKRYDLGGIDPEANPGTYQFKRGLAGKLGQDLTRVGQFELGNGMRGRLLLNLLKSCLSIRERLLSAKLSSAGKQYQH